MSRDSASHKKSMQTQLSSGNAREKTRKVVGVYGGDTIPGAYVKTMTGVSRGDELFSRPDLERPWRSAAQQRQSSALVQKEQEIEKLMRLCSSLRTQLGNAKSDARFIEFATSERTKAECADKDATIAILQEKIEALEKEKAELKDKTEHQIRLLTAQHENEVLAFKAEARLATQKTAELAAAYQKQVEDVKAASKREIEFVETRFAARVNELTAELAAARETGKSAEEHYQEQTNAVKNMLARVESDYKERTRATEQKLEELRKSGQEDVATERAKKEEALGESRRATEQLAAALADKNEIFQRFKLWNDYVLSGLDRFYTRFVQVYPERAVDPADPQLVQIPSLYAPRAALEDPEAKVAVERIVYRLVQLRLADVAKEGGSARVCDSDAAAMGQVTQLADKQDRLKVALRETEQKWNETEASLSSILSRLCFFSDNLHHAVTYGPTAVLPPTRNALFVCVTVPKGSALWASAPETMRTSMVLLNNTIRLKLAEYGGYEAYSDDVSLLLAFGDAAAACRFCTEAQEWLMFVPWPAALLQSPHCQVEGSEEHPSFRGLRVAMALHAGEAFVEPSAIPRSDGNFRCHYYGRAISQIVHIASLVQGGQVIASKPAWQLCLRKRHELGQLVVTEIGSFPIMSFNSQLGAQEKQSIELLQLSSNTLKRRTFRPTSKIDIPTVSSLSGVRRSILFSEIGSIEARRDGMKDAIRLLNEEFHTVQSELNALLARTRKSQGQFHLLPPPEMVVQLNDMYNVMEKIAVRAEELREEIFHLQNVQEDLDAQTHGLKEYFTQQAATMVKEDALRTDMDVSAERADAALKELAQKHRLTVEKLHGALQEREQTIRKLCQSAVEINGHPGFPLGAGGTRRK